MVGVAKSTILVFLLFCVVRFCYANLVLRTGYKVDNPFYYAKQKANNPVQNSPARKPAEMVRRFRMSFFGMRCRSLEIVFRILFSGHIINRLLISSVEKRKTGKQKEILKRELESSCISSSLFSTIIFA